jgi:hypothetical protein
MSDSHAAGRKTDNPRHVSGLAEALLIDQIAALGEHAGFSLEFARTIPAQMDEYGHARGACVNNAIALAKASARLAHAIAEMHGEVRYNFNYSHSREAEPVELPMPRREPETAERIAERDRVVRERMAALRRQRAEAGNAPLPCENPRFE